MQLPDPDESNASRAGEPFASPLADRTTERRHDAAARRDLLRAAVVGLTTGLGAGVGLALALVLLDGAATGPRTAVVAGLGIAALASIAALVQVRRDREVEAMSARISRLELANLELQRLNRGLERFAGAVAHDLRSPMTVVVSTLEFLHQRAEGLTDGERRLLETATRRGHRCVDLTHVLLAQTKQLAAHVERAPVSLGAVIDDALDQLAGEVAQVRPELRIAALPMVLGNRTLLVQVFQNLLSNALRYRHPDRPCRIHITGAQDGEMLRVTVADDGQGVPVEQREAMFRFGASHGGEGTGIGLATASALIAAHGGDIAAEDGPLAGVAIVLTLPVAEDHHDVLDLTQSQVSGHP